MTSNNSKTRDITEIEKLYGIINETIKANPYDKVKEEMKNTMWLEQCETNFPILYLSSIYLYKYAKDRKINKYIFASRDCCHWYKIFNKLYPQENATYFHCSRNMFYNATVTKNIYYKKYVTKEINGANNINNTVFIDIHGTGRRMFEFFSSNFSNVPHYFLLSATFKNYSSFPPISKTYMKQKKVFNLIFNARGGPIEMLNYDLIGTLQNFNVNGPIRDKLEYNIETVEPYHKCIEALINKTPAQNIAPLSNSQLQNIKKKIEEIYEKIREDRPCISKIIDHLNKHGPDNEKVNLVKNNPDSNIVIFNKNPKVQNKQINIIPNDKITPVSKPLVNQKPPNDNMATALINNKIIYKKILSNDTVYGLIWEGMYINEPCVIKMVRISSENKEDSKLLDQNNEIPFLHKEFKNKKTMSKEKFLNEVNQLQLLNQHNLAPKFYEHFIIEKKVQYGFIVMKKLDCSLKDIFKKRNIDEKEDKLIKNMVNKMHIEKKIVHGDMKPSNIAVNLDSAGKIKECYFIDCQKVKSKDKKINDKKFAELIKKDWDSFEKHKKKNRGEK